MNITILFPETGIYICVYNLYISVRVGVNIDVVNIILFTKLLKIMIRCIYADHKINEHLHSFLPKRLF